MLGILSSMCAFATVNFSRKRVSASHASTEQRYIPITLESDPQTPVRSNHIFYGDESHFTELRRELLALQAMGPSVAAHIRLY